MSLPQGWDFRATLAFVTDPANDDFNNDGTLSGTSSNGIAWAWTATSGNSRDRSASVDARLAGIVFVSTGGSANTFTATLPATGTYNITLALGDQASGQTQNFDILDGASVLFNVANNVNTNANQYVDATGVTRTSDTDWVTNNATKSLTFTTTSAGFRLNVPSGSSTTLAHLFIQSAGGATPKFRRTLSQLGTRVGSRQIHGWTRKGAIIVPRREVILPKTT